MEPIDQMVSTVLAHIGNAATSGAVAGEPIKIGEVTIVVLSMVSLGMGAAGGEAQEPPGRSTRGAAPGAGLGEGAGGGAKVRPVAVVAFGPTGVEVLPIPAQPNAFDKVVERVPAVVDMVERARQSIEGRA